jgi:vancomycin permeability regulator SanA
MQDSRLQRRLIIGALAILVLADVALLIITARMSDARQNPDASVAVQSRQVALVRSDVKRASEIQKKIPTYLNRLDDFESSLAPAANGYSSVSQELGDVARKNRLLIDDQKFHQEEVPGRNLTELEIETSVTGDYAGIVRFLNSLQRSKNVYIVNSLQVETQNSTQGQNLSGTLRVNLKMRTCFRKV